VGAIMGWFKRPGWGVWFWALPLMVWGASCFVASGLQYEGEIEFSAERAEWREWLRDAGLKAGAEALDEWLLEPPGAEREGEDGWR
jgi:hypothetical protein